VPPDEGLLCNLGLADLRGVPEGIEETIGGYVPLNEDDDNNNNIPDKDEMGQVNGEDDLVCISLSILPANLNTGEMELKVVLQVHGLKIKQEN
jgi:hypothetical protein